MADRHTETAARLTRERARKAAVASSLASKVGAGAVRLGADPRVLAAFSEHLVRMDRIGTADSDVFRVFGFRGERATHIAAANLAKRKDFVFLPFGNPNANRALARIGKRMGKAARDRYMVDVVIPAAILEAAEDFLRGDRRARIGAQHVVDIEGKRALFDPFDLDGGKLLALLKQRARAIAERTILDYELGPPVTRGALASGLSGTKRSAETKRLVAALRRTPVTGAQLAVAAGIYADESVAETAARIGKTDGAVRALRHRLLRRLRPA